MNVGIEALAFYCPRYYLDLKLLAQHRGVPFAKYYRGIGQEKMGVPAPDEDIVTMGANAAATVLSQLDQGSVESVIFATESGIDQSKAASIYLHRLLDLPPNCRAFEVKQACCSSTMALEMALAKVAIRPQAKILIVASDIAKYGLGSVGEPTQGAGAVAMIVSAEPKLLAIDPTFGSFTEDVMDFWRPNYLEEALVDGKFSIQMYLKALAACWEQYQLESPKPFASFDHFVYHLPFTRMAEKAHSHLARLGGGEDVSRSQLSEMLRDSLHYSRLVGNCYTASLYLSLLSLLENARDDLTGQRIGLFSYGSGCVGTFFSGTVQPDYLDHLHRVEHYRLLTERQSLSMAQYESWYRECLPTDGSTKWCGTHRTGGFRLAGIDGHQRQYERVLTNVVPETQAAAWHAQPAQEAVAAQ